MAAGASPVQSPLGQWSPTILHLKPFSWKTLFPWTWVGMMVLGWFKCITLLCILFLLLLHQLHADHQALITSHRLGTLVLDHLSALETSRPFSSARGWVYLGFLGASGPFIIFKISFYWSKVDLQCYVSFSCTAKLFSYTYTYIPSFSDYLPVSLQSQIITEYWVEFPGLYNRSLLIIFLFHSLLTLPPALPRRVNT